MIRSLGAAAAALAFTAAASVGAAAETALRIQTSMNAGESFYVNMDKYWVPRLAEMTGGEVTIELAPAGAIVPYNETMDAVANGILSGDFTTTVYFAGRSRAFSLIGDLIAGYDRPEQVSAFCYHGGGKEMLQSIYDEMTGGQVVVVGCSPVAREAFVSKVPIRGVDDMKGKKIRAPEGLAAEVFKRAGASVVVLPSSETYTGIDKGVVDAADFSTYTMNDSVGFEKVAKFPIYPGIHSMPIQQLTINKSVWDELTPAQRQIIDIWYRGLIDDLRMRNEISDRELVARDAADTASGIEIVNWPQAERDKFRAIAAEAWAEYAKGDPLAEKAYQANADFMRRTGLLKD